MFGLLLTEGAAACFILLMICVTGIANGPAGMVFFYEKDVQQRLIGRGTLTQDQIDRGRRRFLLGGVLPFFIFLLYAVYGINGARSFLGGFWQLFVLLLIAGLFDRLFIDEWWVGRTKAWIIPGTEDLMPYIPVQTRNEKWKYTLICCPVIAAVLSGVMALIITMCSIVNQTS